MVTESSRNIKRNFIVYRFKRKVEFKRQDKALLARGYIWDVKVSGVP